jgi:two-component system response regulator AtoC
MSRVLIIDDDAHLRGAIRDVLLARRHMVYEAGDGEEGLARVAEQSPDIILLDLELPRLHGLEVLRRVRQANGPPVIVMTMLTDVGPAIEAEKLGAASYVVKPIDFEALVLHVERLRNQQLADQELLHLREQKSYQHIVGASPPMTALFNVLRELAPIDVSTVLVTGESGTGKDVVARALHSGGVRAHAPFIEVDCAALPETLFESTLFGHERGAFTDAKTMKRGLFEIAAAGTIFLDEIGEVPLAAQAKLLRSLENRRFKRVGGVADIPLQAAIVAATNRDLAREVAAGRFREDLYFRLNVFPIALPPLRHRGNDIVVLAEHFVQTLSPRIGRKAMSLADDTKAALLGYSWPGNVRELKNAIERALILTKSSIVARGALPGEVQSSAVRIDARQRFLLPEDGVNLDELERDLLQQALVRANGNRSQAARLLGISRHALTYRMKQLPAGTVLTSADDDD